MVPTAKTKHFFLIFLALICSAVSVYAGGMQEDPLVLAQQLIGGKQYNEAILLIAEVMQNDPHRFDEAQQMLDSIQSARNQYNEKYEELIDIYTQEELDLGRAYEIFEEMEEMDKSPNKATAEAFDQAKATAVFVYNNQRFEKVMENAKVFIDEERYWEAAVAYLEGFDIYREEFELQEYGDIVKNEIENGRSAIENAALAFRETENDITDFFSKDLTLLDQDRLAPFTAAFETYADAVSEASRQRKLAFIEARQLKEQNLEIEKSREEEEFHLSFLYLLTFGRNSAEEPEGIIGAIDSVFQKYIDTLSTRIGLVFSQQYDTGKDILFRGSFPEAKRQLSRAADYGDLYFRSVMLWQTRMYIDNTYGLTDEEFQIAAGKLSDIILYQTRTEALDTYVNLTDTLNELYEIQDGITGLGRLDEVENAREQILAGREPISEAVAKWSEEAGRTAVLQEGVSQDLSGAVAEISEIRGKLREYLNFNISAERDSLVKIAGLRYVPPIAAYEATSAVVGEGTEFLEGYEKPVDEDGTLLTVKDPALAKERFEEAAGSLREIREDFSAIVAFLQSQDDYLLDMDAVKEQIETGNEYISKIDQLDTRTAELIGRSQEQILLAGQYREEGYYRIEQARGALQRTEFENARDQLRVAGERFDLSLSVQDNSDLRTERDTLIANLNEEINTTQNNLIVAEVRELIEDAKENYTQEQYEQAERNLIRAEARWAVTHAESKPEVDYWLQIVRVALYVRTGRDIEETDPLFAEMSQLLNLARENYLEGRRFAELGQREQAIEYFAEAEKNILFVKIPFPLNQEASVLSLRILQYKDPENFDELFYKKFNEAAAQIQTNPQQAYIDLQDLAAIRPNYPGIQNAIYQTELVLGIRIPPPDPEKQRKSDEFYARAFVIVQGGVQAQFPIALEYLNQALALTPENQQVTILLDRVEAEMGGRTTTVLSNAAQQLYRQAEESYINGNYYEALRIVNNLMKDKQSSQYPPLLELKRRIESKI